MMRPLGTHLAAAANHGATRCVTLCATLCLSTLLAACGGGSGSNPFDNPPLVDNPQGSGGRKLSFAYFQNCINPIFLLELTVVQGAVSSRNTCAAAGCHDDTNGTGGALRLRPDAAPVNLADASLTPELKRQTAMYRNFYSAQGEAIPGQPLASRLLAKPLLLNVLHGGGLIFESPNDEMARRIAYWINRPMPAGQDEFSTAGNNLFTPPDPATGACNVE